MLGAACQGFAIPTQGFSKVRSSVILSEVKNLSVPAAKPSQLHETLHFVQGDRSVTLLATWAKPSSQAFCCGGGVTYHRARCVHCLGSVSSGNSPVTLVIEGEVGGLFRLAEPIVIRIIQRNLETSLANLKDIVEAEA